MPAPAALPLPPGPFTSPSLGTLPWPLPFISFWFAFAEPFSKACLGNKSVSCNWKQAGRWLPSALRPVNSTSKIWFSFPQILHCVHNAAVCIVESVVRSSDIWPASTDERDVQPSWELLCSRLKSCFAAGALRAMTGTAKGRLHTCKSDRHAQTLPAVCHIVCV